MTQGKLRLKVKGVLADNMFPDSHLIFFLMNNPPFKKIRRVVSLFILKGHLILGEAK